MVLAAVAGAACLAVAAVAGLTAWAAQTRPPTAAELSAAARAAVARRWRAWPEGRIFPATLGYRTSLLTKERAARVGIAPGHVCAAGLTGTAAALARRDGCVAVLRATYLDSLQGVVYTTGVVAFRSPAAAGAFARAAAHDRLPAGLRAFPLPGTGTSRFADGARQAQASRQAGPYVVLTVAGYADGRPRGAGNRRSSVFAPARQLAAEVLQPLTVRPVVRCGSPGWSC